MKITVVSSGVSMSFRFRYSEEAPCGSAIFRLRSKEAFTSSDVRSDPSENLRPSWRVHSYTVLFESVNSHDSAASGSGLLPPGGICIRF